MGILKTFIFSFVLICSSEIEAKKCNYTASVWNVSARKSLKTVKVSKSYENLTPSERGPFGCTPCLIDQVQINLPFHRPFLVCKFIADKIKLALSNAYSAGFPIREIESYRPSFSKGKLDQYQNRTELSFHSFGTAIDINSSYNGLYNNCIHWGPSCKLIKGGHRDLSKPETILKESPLVIEMKLIGFKWGGEILGKQKDFMHFSESGY